MALTPKERHDKYRAKPGIQERERTYARESERARRATRTPEEHAAELVKQREYMKSPEQRAKATAREAQWVLRQVERGLCIECAELATDRARYCVHHWFVSIGRDKGLTVKNGGVALIKRIWDEQQGLCALTGDPLVRGANASLDHVLAVSRGGDCSRENLRWVLRMANNIKLHGTDAELIDFCRKVVRHHDKQRAERN